ncbi:MAG: hypothetical protein HY303_01080 [Candidatus Wallbacteria bacterium]|nr:hypothetical protein [Candidatus Wallbacteria bacterium]
MTSIRIACWSTVLACVMAASAAAQLPPAAPTGMLPLMVPTAGVPEAGVLAGLPMVERLSTADLRFELRVRQREIVSVRRDASDLRMHLANAAGDPGQAQLAGSLRRTLCGTLDRQATLEIRVAAVERELARRAGLAR